MPAPSSPSRSDAARSGARFHGWRTAPDRSTRSGWVSSAGKGRADAARAVDVEHAVEPAECDPRADAEREVDELVVAEVGVQLAPHLVVDREVVDREPGRELGAQPLARREVEVIAGEHRVVELLRHLVGPLGLAGDVTRGAPTETHVA